MSLETEEFTLGIEEEYQIIDPETRELASNAKEVLALARQSVSYVTPELQRSQVEIASPVCQNLAQVRDTLVQSRQAVIAAANKSGNRIAAAGTHPFSHWEEQDITSKERYQELEEKYQHLAREQLIFGCHVHIGLKDQEVAIDILNRARVWLSPLLALSANSPYWLGNDTGYASYRTAIWSRWPIAGPPQPFESRTEYETLVQQLISSDSIEDRTKLYWDIRIPGLLPTIEFRTMDVCTTIDEAVMVAGLVRALVRTGYEDTLADKPYVAARSELVTVAHWRAARYGLQKELIDLQTAQSVPARMLIEKFLDFVAPALEANGDWDEVSALVQQTLDHGNGAERQRAEYKRTGCLGDIVDFLCAETAKGTDLK